MQFQTRALLALLPCLACLAAANTISTNGYAVGYGPLGTMLSAAASCAGEDACSAVGNSSPLNIGLSGGASALSDGLAFDTVLAASGTPIFTLAASTTASADFYTMLAFGALLPTQIRLTLHLDNWGTHDSLSTAEIRQRYTATVGSGNAQTITGPDYWEMGGMDAIETFAVNAADAVNGQIPLSIRGSSTGSIYLSDYSSTLRAHAGLSISRVEYLGQTGTLRTLSAAHTPEPFTGWLCGAGLLLLRARHQRVAGAQR